MFRYKFLPGLVAAKRRWTCHNTCCLKLAVDTNITQVLTSRIAHLILRYSVSPSSICAVTFTNKAANEMRERLKKILGKHRVGEVRMGTFHSLCAQFLRRYAPTIGLSDNFSICDADERYDRAN